MRSRTALISGAGIAGPALAYWLERYGYRVTVVERTPALRPGGQAIDFTGATHRTVLRRMGIWEEIHARRTGKTDIVFVDDEDVRIAVLSGDFTGGDVEIARGDLARILHEKTSGACEYVFDDAITGLTQSGRGVWVEFERGAPRGFDLVFGADGMHSRVRRLAFGPERKYVKHLGYYYCAAGAASWADDPAGEPERATAYGYSAPGRLVVTRGPKTQQLYLFASAENPDARGDLETQRRIVRNTYADMGGQVPRVLGEMPDFDDFYLDSVSKTRRMKSYTSGRIALVGDSAYGNALAGFGTGLAVVGAYVLAGELALAHGDHTVAFARYDEIMRRYAKVAGNVGAGRFLAPKTVRGLKIRNRLLNSWVWDRLGQASEQAKNTIDLRDYPNLVGISSG